MKISMLVLVATLLVACGKNQLPTTGSIESQPSRLIHGGKGLNKAKAKQLSALVRITMAGSLCSGTYIGNDSILTAYHCVNRIVERPEGQAQQEISIGTTAMESPTKSSDDFEISLPEKTGTFTANSGDKKVTIRLPDLAIIKVKGELASELRKSEAATIAMGTPTLKMSGFEMAGFGLSGFPQKIEVNGQTILVRPPAGRLDFGPADLVRVEEQMLETLWKHGSTSSVALPGDSGGPLYRPTSESKISVYGVLSTLGEKMEGTGFLHLFREQRFRNRYTRLDDKKVQNWLVQSLK